MKKQELPTAYAYISSWFTETVQDRCSKYTDTGRGEENKGRPLGFDPPLSPKKNGCREKEDRDGGGEGEGGRVTKRGFRRCFGNRASLNGSDLRSFEDNWVESN